MRRTALCLVALLASLTAFVPAASSAADLDIVIGGTGVSTYPAFDPAVTRYGIRTTAATGGSVTVTATDGPVTVNGRPAGAAFPVTGLEPGDEVAVRVGATSYAFVYLPPDYPVLSATTTGAVQPGYVFLNIGGYETAVDQNAVPVHLAWSPGSADFKRQPNGHYTSARQVVFFLDYDIVELDEQFRPVATHRMVGRQYTDSHEAVLEADGSKIVIGYEPVVPGRFDSLIQLTRPGGEVFEWSSFGPFTPDDAYVDGGNGDWAHVNSVQRAADGNLIASFRNLSTVAKIATTDSDGHQAGDVLWRLGGKHNDFEFVGDPLGGPCAQHTAYEVAPDRVLIFDNGAELNAALGLHTGNFCPDPEAEDPDTMRKARPHTRAVEYVIDEAAMTATLAWEYDVPGRYSAFAGSTQRLSNGNTLLGWALNGTGTLRPEVATELDDTGENVVWELKSPQGDFSYRAQKAPAPDEIDPEIELTTAPASGATYAPGQVVPVSFGCTDRGGSNLTTCTATNVSGGRLVTSSPGTHSMVVTARDGAGNTSTVARSYTVTAFQPDAGVRHSGATTWKSTARHTLKEGRTAVTQLRVQNDGNVKDSFTVRGSAGGPLFKVRYYSGARNITGRVVAGTYRTASLPPRAAVRLKVTVTRRSPATPGRTKTTTVTALSTSDLHKRDTVYVVARAVR